MGIKGCELNKDFEERLDLPGGPGCAHAVIEGKPAGKHEDTEIGDRRASCPDSTSTT